MPGMGKSVYWWNRYHEQLAAGYTKSKAAGIASIIEERHRAKVKRLARRKR